jgi:hypothetical protein
MNHEQESATVPVSCHGPLGHLPCRGLSYVAGAIGPERIEVMGDDSTCVAIVLLLLSNAETNHQQ